MPRRGNTVSRRRKKHAGHRMHRRTAATRRHLDQAEANRVAAGQQPRSARRATRCEPWDREAWLNQMRQDASEAGLHVPDATFAELEAVSAPADIPGRHGPMVRQPRSGRKNHPPPQQKPQQKKTPKGKGRKGKG